MPDTNVTTNANNDDGSQTTQQTNSSDDLLKRVSEFKPTQDSQATTDDNKFNINELDEKINAIEDPKAREQVFALKKSLISGENTKYQELAELKKALEGQVAQTSSTQNQPWTVERVQSLLQDPTFVSSAQNLSGVDAQADDDSLLSEGDKKKLAKVDSVERQNQQLLQQQNLLIQRQQDSSLKTKYSNYNPEAIDTMQFDIAGKLQRGESFNSREILHKSMDYNDAVGRAYKLGRDDERNGMQDNINAASYQSNNQIVPTQSVKREKGENNESLMRRLYQSALSRGKGGIQT